jgi:subtilase family protein
VKKRIVLAVVLFVAVAVIPAAAQSQFIARDSLGLTALQSTCLLLGCSVVESIDGSQGAVFLVKNQGLLSPVQFLLELLLQPGIVDAEADQNLRVMQSQPLQAPSGLWDTTPVKYYGQTVWDGYANQPAVQIINLPMAQSSFHVKGTGIVAVIDTGVDPTQPVLQGVLLSGYNFINNQQGGSELGDVNQKSMSVVNGAYPAQVNYNTVSVLSQTSATYISQSQYAAFGHGTMVAGVIHLVAPTAQIMPLKAFRADGTGYLSNALRAIYYAAQNNANVLNMSFAFSTYSQELSKATTYATNRGAVCVASVGNNGQPVMVYPAGLSDVVGIASTTNNDTLSSFSNYGQPPVWVGAPGEGVITTYPFGTYAAAWGTSFSTAWVSGTVALMRSINTSLNQQSAAQALTHAKTLSGSAVGYGRLDVYQAVNAWAAVWGK